MTRDKTLPTETQQVALWLERDTFAALKALATQQNVKASRLANQFIREGLGLIAEEHLDGPALPAVRTVVAEITGRQSDRLAGLIVKTLVEAGISRRLTYALVHKQYGTDVAAQLLDATKTRAVESLKKRSSERAEVPADEVPHVF